MRRTRNVVTLLSLLLFLATATIWVSSHWVTHHMYFCAWQDGKQMSERYMLLGWMQGRISLYLRYQHFRKGYFGPRNETRFLEDAGYGWVTEPTPDYKLSSVPGLSFWRRHGFYFSTECREDPHGPDSFHGVIGVAVPAVIPAIALAILPARWFLQTLRRRRRSRLNLCPHCDYDLTGNVTGVCSECGAPVPAAPPVPPPAPHPSS